MITKRVRNMHCSYIRLQYECSVSTASHLQYKIHSSHSKWTHILTYLLKTNLDFSNIRQHVHSAYMQHTHIKILRFDIQNIYGSIH